MQSDTTSGFIGVFEDTGRIGRFLYHPDGFDALASIRTALEAAGVEFTSGYEPKMRIRKKTLGE